jgi:site-specific recombinase XerD
MQNNQRATALDDESVERFCSFLESRGRSEHTVKAYRSDLAQFLLVYPGGVRGESFEDTATSWLTSNRRIVAPKTTGRRLTSLRAFAKWAGWGPMFDDYSAPVPAKSMPHPLPEGFDGVRKLIEACHTEEERSLVALCGMLGCRVSEARSVTPGDFNLGDMTLTIRGKGDKSRIVPLSTEAWDILSTPMTRAFIGGGGPVVDMTDRRARRTITRLGVRAGLKRHIASHDLRATFATSVYDKTLDIRTVQELLGHSSVETTQLYTGVKMDTMRSAVEL